MKVVWLCNYSLQYLKDKLNIDIDGSFFHPTTWMRYLDLEMQKRTEIDLHIITLSAAVDKDYTISENNVTYHIVKNDIRRLAERMPLLIFQKLNHKYESFIIKTFIKPKILGLINNIKPDVVNLHGTEGEYGDILNDVRFPSVIWIQGLISNVVKIDNNIKYKSRFNNEVSLLSNQKNFISIPGSMESIIKSYNTSPNFFNIFHPNSDEIFGMKELQIEKDSDLVYVGQIVKRKGTDDFVEAVMKLKQEIPGIRAKIIGYGGGEYQEYIENKIIRYQLTDNIKMIGFLPEYKDVLLEVKKSKLFVLPTYVDSGPRSVAESMSMGIPVVSYNIDGLPAMINNGLSGTLVEPGNINALSKAILELLNNDELRKNMSEQAYKFALDNFYAPTVIDKLIEAYKKISTLN